MEVPTFALVVLLCRRFGRPTSEAPARPSARMRRLTSSHECVRTPGDDDDVYYYICR